MGNRLLLEPAPRVLTRRQRVIRVLLGTLAVLVGLAIVASVRFEETLGVPSLFLACAALVAFAVGMFAVLRYSLPWEV